MSAKTVGKKKNRVLKPFILSTLLMSTVSLLAVGLADDAYALPKKKKKIYGRAKVQKLSDKELQIIQKSNKALIKWKHFDIEADEIVKIIQNSDQVLVNRVGKKAGESQILGQIQASGGGTVILLNPNGVVFGANSKVDVNRLIVSTAKKVKKKSIKKGNPLFKKGTSDGASIVNFGDITADSGGAVMFVGPDVANHGNISAPLGKVVLANAQVFTVDMTGGEGLINIKVPTSSVAPENGAPAHIWNSTAGTIEADGGEVLLTTLSAQGLYDHAINMDGLIDANGGKVTLIAGGTNPKDTKAINNGTVDLQGTIDVSANAENPTGGDVKIFGQMIRLENGSNIDARGGGTILVGGDEDNPLGGEAPLAVGLFKGFNSQQQVDNAADMDRIAYIQYNEGDSNIVWVAGHDGHLTPEEIEDRTEGNRGRDTHSKEMLFSAADTFFDETGATIHTVTSNLHREKVDLNRDIEDPDSMRESERSKGMEKSLAVQIHTVWYNFNGEAVDRGKHVTESAEGKGDGEVYYVDWHGFRSDDDPHGLPDEKDPANGKLPVEVNLGYDMSLDSLEELHTLLDGGVVTEDVRDILERSALNGIQNTMTAAEIKDFIFGEKSFGHFLTEFGKDADGNIISTTPSPNIPIGFEDGPDAVVGHYQTGGYNVDQHTSENAAVHGTQVHGFQMEIPSHFRHADGDDGTVDLRSHFSQAMGKATAEYMSLNYSIDYKAKDASNYKAPDSALETVAVPVAPDAPVVE